MAIRIPCGALHRPVPEGPEKERIATSAYGLLAMTAVLGTRSFCLWCGPDTPGGVSLRERFGIFQNY